MITLVCPSCASSTTVDSEQAPPCCPECGARLLKPGSDGAPTEGALPEDALLAELRDALGPGTSGLMIAEPWRPGPMGSSTAFSRVLSANPLSPGQQLGDFEIVGELGRGGMGIVYRARQVSTGREVALKVLPDYARYGRACVERFKAEAQAAARLRHPNIVAIYAQGEQAGHYFYAMELIGGLSLAAVIRARPDLLGEPGPTRRRHGVPRDLLDDRPCTPTPWDAQDYRRIAGLLAEIADALDHAHQQGVIHRDIKPQNILLGSDDRLHLTDFGLARLTDAPHLTVTGELLGSPAYLSPEQVRGGKAVDRRSDVYSLGVTLYELLARRRPFEGRTRDRVFHDICHVEPLLPRRFEPRIPADLETICLRAIDKDPRRRHATAAELAEDLRRFAAGQAILSKRTGRLAQLLKRVRQRPGVSIAAVVTLLAVLLAGGLAWSLGSSRRDQANRLLDRAYERLAFFDYRRPDLVRSDLERAADLGADARRLDLARGLACIGAADHATAIQHLEAVITAEPLELRARYLLAWAQARALQRSDSRETFASAEQLGPPATADAWFFRGLAVHYDDPGEAIESYRRANALRAAEHAFYPAAVLHLARARNQQLYATRRIDMFAEADASLRQLIEHDYYDAYPYYLLSIAHRLAAEVYRGTGGRFDEPLCQEHYEQALEWARKGQEKDPSDNRPVTAEAACLESRGQLEEAIAARTRAIALAESDRHRWEGYHYRWRLYYWTGQLEAALQDLEACAGFAPANWFYNCIYPALVHAEMGDTQTALELARQPARDAPSDAQAVLWSASGLRLLGAVGEAEVLLAEGAEAVDFSACLAPPQTAEWMRSLIAHNREGGSLDELESLADRAEQPWRLWGEARFHAAINHLAHGDRDAALADFESAYRSFDSERRYTYHGQLIRRKMELAPDWPPWLKLSWNTRPLELRDVGPRQVGGLGLSRRPGNRSRPRHQCTAPTREVGGLG